MAHIKKASNGEAKISMSTPEWIDIGVKKGFLQVDPRVSQLGKELSKMAGINPDNKVPYSTLKKAMQSEEIRTKLAGNLESGLNKIAQAPPPPSGGFLSGVGNALSAVGGGLATGAGRLGQGLANVGAGTQGLQGALGGLTSGLKGTVYDVFGTGGTPSPIPVTMGVKNIAAGAGKLGLLGGAGLGGYMLGDYATNKFKEWQKGDASPHPMFANDPQWQERMAIAAFNFNQLSQKLRGMSSSIDEQLNNIAGAITDTQEALQAQQGIQAAAPQHQTPDQEYQAQLAAAQAQLAAAQAEAAKRMAGPRIAAPAGLPGTATAARVNP